MRLPETVQAVIFDLDGVILDSEPIHLRISNEMIEGLADPVGWDEYAPFIGKTDDAYFTFIQERIQTSRSVEDLVAENKHRLDVYFNETLDIAPIDGIRELVRGLAAAGYKLAIASSSSHVNINHALRAARLEEYFTIRVSGEDVEHGKPAPDIYLEAARCLGVTPGTAAAIEDSEAGCRSAKSAGLYTIGFRNHGSGRQDLSAADAIITHFDEIEY